MPLIFYPHEDDLDSSSLQERLDILMDAAERYKAIMLDLAAKAGPGMDSLKRNIPKDIAHSYNWEEISKILREIREMPESSSNQKTIKAEKLTKLADIYEVLRGAKMPKLEAVRLALINEANQLKS